MTCDFRSFSTVFHLYQDDEEVKLKGYVQRNSIHSQRDFSLERVYNPGDLDQLAMA